MGLFSIDIEKFYEEIIKNGQQLKGVFCIQYPIYCIHANIIDFTPDPLGHLDNAIINFLVAKPDFTSFQIASLMGTSKLLIEKRIQKLLNDDLIIQNGKKFLLSDLGILVFKEKKQVRQQRLSYDFYLDGLTLEPLENVFYGHYSSKFISENDFYYRTNKKGETKLVKPFGPDLVHTPPEKDIIFENIFRVEISERSLFSIPPGLHEINDVSFTKLTLQLLVSVSSGTEGLTKQLIDGFAIFSMSDNISYYDALRKNVISFEKNIKEKIDNLLFKITIHTFKTDNIVQTRPVITSNWQQINKNNSNLNKCFLFSTEDLIRVFNEIFNINPIIEESIVNEENEIVININTKMLLNSPNRTKLVQDLIRQRDYKFGSTDYNVFLLYVYFISTDDFVNQVVQFKKNIIDKNRASINVDWLYNIHPEYSNNYRNLLIASGEYEILENLDIEKHMKKIS
jgi:hypothetical protein